MEALRERDRTRAEARGGGEEAVDPQLVVGPAAGEREAVLPRLGYVELALEGEARLAERRHGATVEAQEFEPVVPTAQRRELEVRGLPQDVRVARPVERQALQRDQRHQRRQVGQRVEVERQIAQGLQAHGEAASLAARLGAGGEQGELPITDGVARQVQRLEVHGELEAGQVADPVVRGVERGQLAQVARQDPLAIVVTLRERLVGAGKAVVHMDERRVQIGARDRSPHRLGEGHAQPAVDDGDRRIHRRPLGRDRAALASGRQRPLLAGGDVLIMPLDGFEDRVVAPALTPGPIQAHVADEQVVPLAAVQAIAVRNRMHVALHRRLDLEDEGHLGGDLAARVVHAQVVRAGLDRAQIDRGLAERDRGAIGGDEVRHEPGLGRRHEQTGPPAAKRPRQFERDRLGAGEVLDAHGEPRVAPPEGRLDRARDVHLCRLGADERGNGQHRGRAAVGRGHDVVALAGQHAHLELHRRGNQLVEHDRALVGPVRPPELAAGGEVRVIAGRRDRIGVEDFSRLELGRVARRAVRDPETAVGLEEHAHLGPHTDRRDLPRVGAGAAGNDVLHLPGVRGGGVDAVGSPQLGAGAAVGRREVQSCPGHAQVGRIGADHLARQRERAERGREDQRRQVGLSDVRKRRRGRVRHARRRGVELAALDPEDARLAVEAVRGREEHAAAEERQEARRGAGVVAVGDVRELDESRAVVAEHLAIRRARGRLGRDRPRFASLYEELLVPTQERAARAGR